MNQITERMTATNALPDPQPDWALFLDVDGTLVEIAQTPEGVTVPVTLPASLRQISAALNGAVALVSGRSIANMEALLGPMPTAIAGLHGLEVRPAANQEIRRVKVDSRCLADARAALQVFAKDHDGVTLEDKGLTLALHYRKAPELQAAAEQTVAELLTRYDGRLHAIRGKMVIELKPPGADKGTAIETMMAAPPFKGRRAVFVGDDVTDEDGFAAVNRLGGISIRVGAPANGATASLAQRECDSVTSFVQWLQDIPERLSRYGGDVS